MYGFISSVTLTEIYYIYARRVGTDVARKRVEQIKLSNLKMIPIADALIAACAHSVGAKVVTDDKHFEELDVRVVKFRD